MDLEHIVGIVGVGFIAYAARQKDTDRRSAKNKKVPAVIGIVLLAICIGLLAFSPDSYEPVGEFMNKQ